MDFVKTALFGPRIYSIFDGVPRSYPSNLFESSGDTLLSVLHLAYSFATGLSPLIAYYVFSRDLVNVTTLTTLGRTVGVYTALAFGLRTAGRLTNEEYRRFAELWSRAQNSQRTEDREELRKYDFQIVRATPVDFEAKEREGRWFVKPDVPEANPLTRLVASLCVHSFGRRMLYPGSLAILNALVSSTVIDNRAKLICLKQGRRVTLKTRDGNLIDALYVDRRGTGEVIDSSKGHEKRGDVLVVACEGNAGYYEVGIGQTPLELGYSTLGWNHPGFLESHGLPYPEQTLEAMEAVMQFATDGLGFAPQNIVLFGWSIGGFPSTWAAANWKNVRALVLDATFDDLLPLAKARMPSFAEHIVHLAVREHLNLEIAKQMLEYPGPISLIRRLDDDIITTADSTAPEAEQRHLNRANDLLLLLLRHRHPGLVDGLEDEVGVWLSLSPIERLQLPNVTLSAGQSPSSLSREQRVALMYTLADHYFRDFDASHVTPLHPQFFHIPSPLTY